MGGRRGKLGAALGSDGKPRILAELWGVHLSKSQPRVQKTAESETGERGRSETGKQKQGHLL